jgi:hypothetical protein
VVIAYKYNDDNCENLENIKLVKISIINAVLKLYVKSETSIYKYFILTNFDLTNCSHASEYYKNDLKCLFREGARVQFLPVTNLKVYKSTFD